MKNETNTQELLPGMDKAKGIYQGKFHHVFQFGFKEGWKARDCTPTPSSDSVKALVDALKYVLSCRREVSEDGKKWNGWILSAGSAPGNHPAINNAVPLIIAALTPFQQPEANDKKE